MPSTERPSDRNSRPDSYIEPVESVVVVEVSPEPPPEGWGFLEMLQRADGGEREVVLVCRRDALIASRPPGWVRVVPLPDDEPPSFAQARRIGVLQASGDVIRLVTVQDLMALRRGEPQFSMEGWLERLGEHGIAPPERPKSR